MTTIIVVPPPPPPAPTTTQPQPAAIIVLPPPVAAHPAAAASAHSAAPAPSASPMPPPIIVIAPETQQKTGEAPPPAAAGEILEVKCPYCRETALVARTEINCQIFVHGYYRIRHSKTAKTSEAEAADIDRNNALLTIGHEGMPVDPHMSAQARAELVRQSRVIGCCRSFRYDGQTVVPLDGPP